MCKLFISVSRSERSEPSSLPPAYPGVVTQASKSFVAQPARSNGADPIHRLEYFTFPVAIRKYGWASFDQFALF